MKKLTKRSLIILVIAIISLIGIFAIACSDDNKQNKTEADGPEVGGYYCAAGGEDYTIDLLSGKRFVLTVNGEEKAGKYSVKDNELTFTFDKVEDGKMNAELSDMIMRVTYNDSQMLFIKYVILP